MTCLGLGYTMTLIMIRPEEIRNESDLAGNLDELLAESIITAKL